MWETVVIAGIEVLAKFARNGECVSIDMAIATKDRGIQEESALIPHGLEPIEGYRESVPATHKQAAIAVFSQWIADGLLVTVEYEPSRIRYSPTFRGYANFIQLDQCVAISTVNKVEQYLQAATVGNILSKRAGAWMSESEKQDFVKRCDRWKSKNCEYLKQKSRDFASFWTNTLGTLGSSGDGMIDLVHAYSRSRTETAISQADLSKFNDAVYAYAMSKLNDGQIPFLDTDYGVGRGLAELLSRNGLNHLAGSFPFKTWTYLNFDDCDRAALFSTP